MSGPGAPRGARLLVLALVALTACEDDGSETGGAPADTGAGGAVDADAAAVEPDAGVTPDPDAAVEPPAPDAATGPQTLIVVLDTVVITSTEEDGVTAPGFDLDGVDSDFGDETTCNKPDFTAPDGTPGVDNQIATLIPVFQQTEIGIVESLVQNAIEEGGLLVLLQIDGVDDRENDPEVGLTLRLGTGVPLLGTDRRLVSDQTFELHPDTQDPTALEARIEDGVLHARGLDGVLPVVVFGVTYELEFQGARARATLTDDHGLTDGLLGARVPVASLLDILHRALGDGAVVQAAETLLRRAADLGRDEEGICTELSAALAFTGKRAFLF
jgi:hypothetical protein